MKRIYLAWLLLTGTVGSALLIPRLNPFVHSNGVTPLDRISTTSAQAYWKSRDLNSIGYFTREQRWPQNPELSWLGLSSVSFDQFVRFHTKDLISYDALLSKDAFELFQENAPLNIPINALIQTRTEGKTVIIGAFDQETTMTTNGIFNYENKEDMFWITITMINET